LHPVLARVAPRGNRRRGELEDSLSGLLPPSDAERGPRAALLADAIAAGKRMLIVADYDCDGATACAWGMRALSAWDANVGYLVPNRFEFGYGLDPGDRRARGPVETGTPHHGGQWNRQRRGRSRGGPPRIEVIVTDHHLPGSELPRAAAIVNSQPGRCAFPSRASRGSR